MEPATRAGLRSYLGRARKPWIALLAFVPAVLTFFAAFLPVASRAHVTALLVVAAVALVNGSVEEVFWRGLVLARPDESPRRIVASQVLFTVFHFAFLFLPVSYHGGAAALVGGAAFMGALWLAVTRYGGSLLFVIAAHVLTNFFAFTQLFTENELVSP